MARWMVLLMFVVAGCGTSDPATWETCSGCATRPDARWDVIADGAELSGSYDVVGPPDPYICLTVQHQTHCSAHVSDSATPRWDDVIMRAVSTTVLTAEPLTVGIWDKDTGGLDANDFVCSTELQVSAADLEAGGTLFSCPRGNAAFRFQYVR